MLRAKPVNPVIVRFAAVLFWVSCPNFWDLYGSAQPNGGNSSVSSGNGICGAFGVYDQQSSPVCSCLTGFYPSNRTEWGSGDWTSGCLRRTPLNCLGANATASGLKPDGFSILHWVEIPSSMLWFSYPEEQCEPQCLSICSCLAYAFQSGNRCTFWTNVTSVDARISTNSSLGADVHIRLANSELGDRKGSNRNIVISMVVVGLVLMLSVSLYFTWKWKASMQRSNAYRAGREGEDKFSETGSVDSSHQCAINQLHLEELPLFNFKTLANATNYFSESNKLGVGGFGPVYKGVLPNGKEIAVKRLAKASGQGMQEFMNEVKLISKVQHRNLVRLLGGCVENKETMLIYEYMPNKSLDFYLFDQSQNILDWRTRFNIIEGICRGLLYLHRDSRLKIIHRDLKPSNILLDNDLNPKISDFGMARIYGTAQDHVSTVRVVGTFGYMAPEYAMKGRFSEKSDVFSLGVLIVEIITGTRNTSIQDDGSLNLVGHIWKLWNEDNGLCLIDSRIYSPIHQAEAVRCIHIGLLCVQEFTKDRPSASDVLSMLSSGTMELPDPKQPAFTVKVGPSQDSGCSANVTITMVHGR